MAEHILVKGRKVNETRPLPTNVFSGVDGGVFITGTSEVTGDFYAIQFSEESVISAITVTDFTGSFAGETVPAGFVIYGNTTAITLTSGACIAYNRV